EGGTEEEAEVADGGHGGERHARAQHLGAAGGAIDQGDHRRDAGADEKESYKGGEEPGEAYRQEQPRSGEGSAELQHAADAPFGGEPVAEETARRHGGHKGGESDAGEGLGWEDDLLEIYIAPVEHRALAYHGAEGDDTEVDQRAVGPREDGLVSAVRGITGDQPARQDDNDDIGDCGDDEEMLPGTPAEADEGAADGGARETGETPETVIRGHDGAAIERLGAYRLGVDRDVEEVAEHAETEQAGHQLPCGVDKTEDGEGGGV